LIETDIDIQWTDILIDILIDIHMISS
jgi:hypothetical protein